ncbi:transcription elongation factor GreA [Deinobacterium chartae]|uniref:Transcription elongation factor GreA n=1 Tax=Deinobacterium chartae TaxID=521158 RepID=A0A841HVU3_9DEIO|nr:transcription elongation factor GreA [Deinobacterium chartae]MBB6097036.1 transcription elongation factor GreA [Deinobacterium chartae]
MSQNKIRMTQKGYDKLVADLEILKTVRRDQISEYMGNALADGDLRESAAYDEARMMQSENEARIAMLEDQLARAVIVEEGDRGGDPVVGLGATVEVEAGGRRHKFEIVGTYEVDVLKGKISDQSPIGQALQNHKAGDKVKVALPKGAVEYTIIDVRYE